MRALRALALPLLLYVCHEVDERALAHYSRIFVFFFFQAEDGIRDLTVTGVQTCALPIFYTRLNAALDAAGFDRFVEDLCRRFYAPVMGRPSLEPGRYFRLLLVGYFEGQIGRASCRERV